MSFFAKTKTNASRKVKRCSWCGEIIEVGQPKVTQSGMHDGEFQTHHCHPECDIAETNWLLENRDEELPDIGSMKRGTTESRWE